MTRIDGNAPRPAWPRRGAGWATAAVLALTPGLAHADAIDDLRPGTWYAIPDTLMRDVCPENTEVYDWHFHCHGVIRAWNGGALDTTRSRMILFGGGHGDYRGNEVYVFDLHTLEWERVWGPTPDAQIPSGGTHEVYDDGNPGSRHSYSGLTYLPPPHDALVSMGGSLWQSGNYAIGTWSFSFENNAWTRLADGTPQMSYGDPSVFDPQTGHIFRRNNVRMVEYDPDADTFTDRAASDGGFWASNVSAALDPDARLMLIVGAGRLDTYELDTDIYTYDVPVVGQTVEELFGGAAPGVAFDSMEQRFVVYGGGLDVHIYDPATSAFTVQPMVGDDPGPFQASGGAFSRFAYVPARNVFVWVNHVDQDVHVLRMTAGDRPGGGTETGGLDETGDEPGSTSGAGSSTGGGQDSASSGGSGGGEPGSGVTGAGGGTETAGASDDDDAGGGCGCVAAPAPRDAGSLLLLALLGLRRRRGLHRR